MKKVLSVIAIVAIMLMALSSAMIGAVPVEGYANLVSIENLEHPGSADFWIGVYKFDRDVGADHRLPILYEINGINLSSGFDANLVSFEAAYDNTDTVVINIHSSMWSHFNLQRNGSDIFIFDKYAKVELTTPWVNPDGSGWYYLIYNFDRVVSDEYLNKSWYTVNGIRSNKYDDGVHVTIQRWGLDNNQIAVGIHSNLYSQYEIDTTTDILGFSPIIGNLIYSVDVQMPETFAGRGNIVLSGNSLAKADITDNQDAVILTFFKAGSLLRVGLHEAFDVAGNANAGLQIRRDMAYFDQFTLQISVDGNGKYMLYILNSYGSENAYFRIREINSINWNNTTIENKFTYDLSQGTTYDITTGGAGWEGHDGVISFFNNFPTNLTAVYDTDAVAYIYSNAKTAAEAATYSDQPQGTSETDIENAIKDTAETAIADPSVTVTVNKVSYTLPTAGTSANPTGTNGSYSFTITTSLGVQSETTEEITIAITATTFTGVTDVQAVAAAKIAIVDGTVNVEFGADQATKTAAVQTFVNSLLTEENDAEGVTATVTHISGNNYSVAISKGSENDTKTITMTINVAATPGDKFPAIIIAMTLISLASITLAAKRRSLVK